MTRDKLLVGMLGAILGISLVSFVMGISKVIGKPFELVFGESFLWYQADLVSRGGTLYQPLTSTQLQVLPHTPLFALTSGGLSSLFGSSITTGRVLALLCGIGICVLVVLLTKKFTGSWTIGILTGLLLVSSRVFRFLAPINRMDTMGMLLSLLGIYFFIKWENKGRWIYWTIPFFVLAFFTKQYFISAPLGVGIYLLTRRNWKASFSFGGFYLGTLGLGLILGGLLTNWELITQNFIYLGYSSQMSWNLWVGQIRAGAFYHFFLLIGLFGYFGYKLVKKSRLEVLDIYCLVSLVVFLALVGKRGASYHYMLELVSVGCILVGVLLDRSLFLYRGKKVSMVQAFAGGLLIVILLLQPLGFPLGQGLRSYEYLETTEASYRDILDHIEESGSAVFCDDWVYPMLVEQEGIEVEWQPWDPAALYIGKLHQVEGRYGWDQSDVLQKLDTGYYRLVILEYDLEEIWSEGSGSSRWEWLFNERLSVEVGEKITDNYQLVHTTDWMGTAQQSWKTYLYEYEDGGYD